ncbi:aldehyde dehydrogenase [Cohnella lubricantis]|uniref:Aldehyde dehydrogenase n=1 Tax=Cohnella lubricantis TaxID=2163172 RepID=A0A841TB86_9BACL|nr:aldehyde dehydrogenase [Cohnella lubricantis]MBB6676648.1 aldehyde dehydrogenase [Cohnella lubricantis]MBP2120434.1 aldehyde dehydrogenase (NAD+) [Cohnella lubricantis]
MAEIAGILKAQRKWFGSGSTRSLDGRMERLNALHRAIAAREAKLLQALMEDLGKSEQEAYTTEIGIIYHEIRFVRKHLRRWAKPRKVKTALTHVGSKGFIMPEPYGSVLIISPWNYPFQLTMGPLIGAVAAGNTAIVKPSELSPHVSAVIAEIVADAFPPECAAVVQGGPETSEELLRQKFDLVFFTGSTRVGRIVMEAAAKQLTPVILELGGKSPCIVHKDADLKLAARRIAFGKFTNAGQTCIAPDYLYVHRDVKVKLVAELKQAIREFYGEEPLKSAKYGRIVSERHFERLVRFAQDGRLLAGGEYDAASLRLAPTLIEPSEGWDAAVMQEEIFGPVFPVLEYRELDEAIREIAARPKPLALYLFTSDPSAEKAVLERVSFGGGCVNDTLMHIATPHLPFGGVGESGIGSYHGSYSFQAFSHEKSVLKQTTRFDFAFRYPSSEKGLAILRKLLK